MAGNWFRKRTPPHGTGYGIGNWKGVVATVVYIALNTAIPIGAIRLYGHFGGSYWPYIIVALSLFVVLLAGFLGLVVVKSDRR